MQEFRDGQIDVLVSTTVIEVGVDVPNATVMIVEDADRFGLAQLHQLRGRVGRGRAPRRGLPRSPTRAARRAGTAWTRWSPPSDGFELAEQDLRLRGEGQILGDRQHGLPALRLASVLTDGAAHRDGARGRTRRSSTTDPHLTHPSTGRSSPRSSASSARRGSG